MYQNIFQCTYNFRIIFNGNYKNLKTFCGNSVFNYSNFSLNLVNKDFDCI